MQLQCRDYTLQVYVCSFMCAVCLAMIDTVKLCRKHHAVRHSSDLFHSMTLGCAQT